MVSLDGLHNVAGGAAGLVTGVVGAVSALPTELAMLGDTANHGLGSLVDGINGAGHTLETAANEVGHVVNGVIDGIAAGHEGGLAGLTDAISLDGMHEVASNVVAFTGANHAVGSLPADLGLNDLLHTDTGQLSSANGVTLPSAPVETQASHGPVVASATSIVSDLASGSLTETLHSTVSSILHADDTLHHAGTSVI